MTSKARNRNSAVPVVCTLSADQVDPRLLEWSDLRGQAISVARIDGGARMTFAESIEPELRKLVVRESACCAFLEIDIHPDGPTKTVTLAVTSANPQALPVIEALAGTAAE